jgi:hypothetical protein
MGKGYYFNMDTEEKAVKAARLFYVRVFRNYQRRCRPLGVTKTLGGRWVSGMDVCGPYNENIALLQKRIIEEVEK